MSLNKTRKEAVPVMKRGLISWDRAELPPRPSTARLSALYQLCDRFRGAGAGRRIRTCGARMTCGTSRTTCRTGIVRSTVVARGEKPILLCALSPRVYPWIKSVTVHETIFPSPSLPAQLVKLCAREGLEQAWGARPRGLPNDLYTQTRRGKTRVRRYSARRVPAGRDGSEIAMHRRAAVLAREVLDAEVTRRGHRTQRLELDRAGSNGASVVPGPKISSC